MAFGFMVAVAALAVAAGPQLQRFEAVEPHMGTLVRITIYTTDETSARAAFRAAFERIADLDRTLSDYKTGSELNAITKSAVGRAVTVSDDLFAVLRTAQDLAEASGGAFDVTQGPVVRLWRETRRTGRLPDAEALEEAASRSGFRKLRLDAARRTVMLDVPDMALDVGAIGKGYAASEALRVLGARGIRSALVAVSGDLAFSDAPPGRAGWRIQLLAGDNSIAGVPSVLEMSNAAVSTSGNSEQHLDVGGRRYSHIVDPASREALVDDITVTVVAQHGLDADGLDTAISVLGVERGIALADSRGAAALIVQRVGRSTTARMSAAFLERIRKKY
jgi:thiamine biosynthesis lipoprotein